ncbi:MULTISPECIES: transposase domain-containing protein [Rhizobium]|uniref:transposase domain-containing protein n=1 Tax=Rhizobium TaxID=379 RepID=UPI001FEDF092|nr:MULTISPECIES: transposase domain-containing protein [Rhizobium]
MLTCRACGVEPLTWLRHVLTEFASARCRRSDALQLHQKQLRRKRGLIQHNLSSKMESSTARYARRRHRHP